MKKVFNGIKKGLIEIKKGLIVVLKVMPLILLTNCGGIVVHPSNNNIDGFNDIFKNYSKEGNTDKEKPKNIIDVLLVHGMRNHLKEWSLDVQKEISNSVLGTDKPTKEIAKEYRVRGELVGHFLRKEFEREYESETRVIRFFELTWSPLTKEAKRVFLDLDEELKENNKDFAKRRAYINKVAKDLVNEGFSDAILYTGMLQKEIQNVLKRAIFDINQINNENTLETDIPLVVIAESLGSKIVFDSLADVLDSGNDKLIMHEDSKVRTKTESNSNDAANSAVKKEKVTTLNLYEAASNAVNRIEIVYLFAHQIPLLDLVTYKGPGDKSLENYPCPPERPDGATDSSDAPSDTHSYAPSNDAAPSDAPYINSMNSMMFIADKKATMAAEKYKGIVKDEYKLPIVAFSDTNDAMTFWISDRFRNNCAKHNIGFINVIVKNTFNWLIYASLKEAHGGHINNKHVVKFLANGFKTMDKAEK